MSKPAQRNDGRLPHRRLLASERSPDVRQSREILGLPQLADRELSRGALRGRLQYLVQPRKTLRPKDAPRVHGIVSIVLAIGENQFQHRQSTKIVRARDLHHRVEDQVVVLAELLWRELTPNAEDGVGLVQPLDVKQHPAGKQFKENVVLVGLLERGQFFLQAAGPGLVCRHDERRCAVHLVRLGLQLGFGHRLQVDVAQRGDRLIETLKGRQRRRRGWCRRG